VCLIIDRTHCDVRDVIKVRATLPKTLKNQQDTLRYSYLKFYKKNRRSFFANFTSKVPTHLKAYHSSTCCVTYMLLVWCCRFTLLGKAHHVMFMWRIMRELLLILKLISFHVNKGVQNSIITCYVLRYHLFSSKDIPLLKKSWW